MGDGGHRRLPPRLGRAAPRCDLFLEGRGADGVGSLGGLGPDGIPACASGSMTAVPLLLALALAASPQSSLVQQARDQPDSVRETLRRLFAAGSDSALVTAGRVASAYAIAWRDSFFVRQVARLSALPSAARRAKVVGDSLRRAGN